MARKIFYVLGATCSGKDWFVEHCVSLDPQKFGAVQVGKEFRRRYPPGYFAGSAAPEHTEREAIQIFEEQLAANHDKEVVLVTGQPRRVSQIKPTVLDFPGDCIWIYAPRNVCEARAKQRDAEPAALQLAMDRMVNDRVELFDVLYHLILAKVKIIPVVTEDAAAFGEHLCHFSHLDRLPPFLYG